MRVVDEIEATLLLANAANAGADGLLHVLGMGWDVTGPSPLPGFAVLAHLKIPPALLGKSIGLHLRLADDADATVSTSDASSPRPVDITTSVDAPPPESVPEGIWGTITLAVEMGAGLILRSGNYVWILKVDVEPDREWRRRFHVRATPSELTTSSDT